MDSIVKGKRIVITIIVTILLIDIVTIAVTSSLYAASGNVNSASYSLLQGIFRFILEGLILIFLYKGHKWAKWLLSILLLIAGLFSLISLIAAPNMILLFLGLVYLGIGIILLSSGTVRDFFSFQRGELKSTGTESSSSMDN